MTFCSNSAKPKQLVNSADVFVYVDLKLGQKLTQQLQKMMAAVENLPGSSCLDLSSPIGISIVHWIYLFQLGGISICTWDLSSLIGISIVQWIYFLQLGYRFVHGIYLLCYRMVTFRMLWRVKWSMLSVSTWLCWMITLLFWLARIIGYISIAIVRWRICPPHRCLTTYPIAFLHSWIPSDKALVCVFMFGVT